MKMALKIAGWATATILLLLVTAYAAIFFLAARPEHAVGFQEVTVRDPQDKPLQVGIWYPTTSPSRPALAGLSAQMLATNGVVAGNALPLIVISHGNNGLFASHSDTALALASAGFVVAAVTHTGDNAEDSSYVGTSRWLTDRPRHIHLVLDYMLKSWPAHDRLDGRRIGMFGFSAGGFTTLVSIGGEPSVVQIAAHCAQSSELACTLWKGSNIELPSTVWIHDSRIRAAAIAAPGFGFSFEPGGLSSVTAAVQLWNGTNDNNVPYESNEAVVRRLLPTAPEYHAVRGAAHFAFLAPCPSFLIPAICKDAPGFDRTAFHRDFNGSVIAFFRKNL